VVDLVADGVGEERALDVEADALGWLVRHLDPVLQNGHLMCESRFKNNYFTEMCSGSEAGSYLRLLYHSTLGLRVITKNKKLQGAGVRVSVRAQGLGFGFPGRV